MLQQPVGEQILRLQRQTQEDIAGLARAIGVGAGENGLHLVVRHAGDDRRDHDRGRNAGLRQLLDRLQPARRRRRARLHRPRQIAVERRHRQRHLDQPALRHGREEIEIAQDQRGFGDDRDRVIGLRQNLQNSAHDAMLAFDRLVGIGVGSDRDDLGLVIRRGQFALQHLRGVVLDEQAAFEIEPRRQAEKSVRRPRETIDAAVLATAIGVDAAFECNVGGIVARDDCFRLFMRDLRPERRQVVERAPAVVDLGALEFFETPGQVARGRPAATARGGDWRAFIGGSTRGRKWSRKERRKWSRKSHRRLFSRTSQSENKKDTKNN